MVFLHDIVTVINDALKNRLSKFPAAEYNGIATQTVKPMNDGVTISFPSIITNDGRATSIDYNNKPPFIIYHRVYTTTFIKKESYGDGDISAVSCSTVMRLICTGNRKDLKVTAEEFAMIIAESIPGSLTIEGVAKNVMINSTLIQYDSRVVFNGEFEKLGYLIGPDRFLFSIQYSITGNYIKGCLLNCDC